MTKQLNRAEMVVQLEKIFKKRVFVFVFNPAYENGIQVGDEKYFEHFIEEIIVKENIKDCVLIFSGFGGNLKTAILCSEILRNNIRRYSCFIPSVACSSICYFILQSNKLLIGNKSIITQIDPVFNYDGEDLRAIKHLNDPDARIRTLAHDYFNPVFENLKRVILNRPHVFQKSVSKETRTKVDYFIKISDVWMGKELHETGLNEKDFTNLKVNFDILEEDVVKKGRALIKECMKELMDEEQRFVIQTSQMDGNLHGGFFHP